MHALMWFDRLGRRLRCKPGVADQTALAITLGGPTGSACGLSTHPAQYVARVDSFLAGALR